MTAQELAYGFNQMTKEDINSWLINNYGETIESSYGEISHDELVEKLAYDNAQ